MEWYKVAFGEIYPLVYPHRDDEEALRVAHSLLPLLEERSPLVDVACGNGRYMRAFQQAGLDVYGIDLSAYLLADAVASRALRGRVVIGDMRLLPFRDECAGAVVNMFTSFGYFETDLDNVRVMQEIARVLAPGGRFLMDFLNAGVLERELSGGKPSVRGEDDIVIEELRQITDEGRVLEKRVRVTGTGREPVDYSERLRLYRHDDLAAMAEASGLRPLAVYGDYDLGGFDAMGSPRVLLLCEKPRSSA
ncbi:MAG TPA: class I SAM-dependent methyltransferase [Candidatus Krumholzibacteria bacterium]|nr:class I SAM-dependent methyltransferase [Candidatus Krumholzibacteria bacterium]